MKIGRPVFGWRAKAMHAAWIDKATLDDECRLKLWGQAAPACELATALDFGTELGLPLLHQQDAVIAPSVTVTLSLESVPHSRVTN